MRLKALFLSFYMLIASIGIHLSLHFCNGELACFSLSGSESFCCHNTAHPNHSCCITYTCKKDCCETQFLNITLEDDFIIKSNPTNIDDVSLAVKGIPALPCVDSPAVFSIDAQPNAPPEVELYALNCSFLFYG